MALSQAADAYMREVWEAESIQELEPIDAFFILENAHDKDNENVLDKELWNAYAEMHNLPTWENIDHNDFFKTIPPAE